MSNRPEWLCCQENIFLHVCYLTSHNLLFLNPTHNNYFVTALFTISVLYSENFFYVYFQRAQTISDIFKVFILLTKANIYVTGIINKNVLKSHWTLKKSEAADFFFFFRNYYLPIPSIPVITKDIYTHHLHTYLTSRPPIFMQTWRGLAADLSPGKHHENSPCISGQFLMDLLVDNYCKEATSCHSISHSWKMWNLLINHQTDSFILLLNLVPQLFSIWQVILESLEVFKVLVHIKGIQLLHDISRIQENKSHEIWE